MKNEQAIEKLKRGVDFLSMIDDAEAKELVECYILAIKALQREIPKNPVVNFVGDSDGSRRLNKWWAEDALLCPACHSFVGATFDEMYCRKCGQKIVQKRVKVIV